MRNTKRKSLMALLVASAVCLSGCSNDKATSNTSGKGIKILYTYSVENGNTFRDVLADSAAKYAESVGAEIDFSLAEGNLEKQVSDITIAAENGYDVIMCIPENPDTAKQIIAAAEGLPIVFLNSSPSEDVLRENCYIYVGSDESVAGQYQANYVIQNVKGAKDVVILKGSKGHSATTGRSESLVKELTANGLNIVFNDYADFDTATAKEIFDVFLETGKNYDTVLCNNDAIALGVVQSLQEHGINPSDIPILGVDGTTAGCQAIVDGTMCYTVYQSASGQGEYAARAAIELASGGSIASISYAAEDLKHVWVPFEEVDASNVKSYMQ